MDSFSMHEDAGTTRLMSMLLQGALALLLLQLCRMYLQWRLSPLHKLPGPRDSFWFFGEFRTIFREPFFAPHLRWWKEYKHPPLMSYYSLFGRWAVIPTDPEILKHILTAPSAKEPVRYYKNFLFFRELVGDGLASLEGRTWSRHRRILQPCFQTGLLREALSAAVPPKVDNLIASWKKSEGRVIDVYPHMSAVTLDILGEVSFAHNFRALDTVSTWADGNTDEIGEIQDPMMQTLAKVFKPSMLGIILGLLKLGWMTRYISSTNSDTRRLLDEAADNILQSTKDNPPSSNKTQSLIHVLLSAMEKDGSDRNSLTMQEMRDEIKMFIIAGHETTSTWAYWALYALGKHPDVQERVLEDIQKHAPDDGSPIGLDAVAQMEYFLAFLQECLRLYSPAGMIFRFAHQDESWNGAVIPKKTRIVIPMFLMHRHPDFWVEPNKFLPERWLDPKQAETRHPFCFLPFSAGGRNCIGEKFARFEAELILVNLIREFRIQLAPSIRHAELEFRSSLTMKSKPKVEIVVKSR